MIRGFYSATSGLIGQQDNMNTISNNIANVQTTGFKPQKAAFSSLLYSKLHGGAGVNVSTGHGTRVHSTGIDFNQGGLTTTNVETDVAIMGEGFFAVSVGDGDDDIMYTRAGDFKYSVEDGTKFLIDSMGGYVLNADGERVELEEDETLDPNEIGVYKFWNRHGLDLKGNNRFAATELSGEAEAVEEGSVTVRSGCLESSKVDVAMEMVRMIESSKAFSFNSRVVTTIDEMEKVVNQLR